MPIFGKDIASCEVCDKQVKMEDTGAGSGSLKEERRGMSI